MEQKKVTLYIDAANLILSARNFNLQYDIKKLLIYLKDKYKIYNAVYKCVYFTGKIKILEEDYEYLNSLGVEIVFKDIYRDGKKVKANCDVEISHRITYDIEHKLVDKFVLVTGDGDFSSLLDYAHSRIDSVNIFAIVPKNTAYLLTKKSYYKIIYLKDIISLVEKEKGPAIHEKIEGALFNGSSISNTVNLSNHIFNKTSKISL